MRNEKRIDIILDIITPAELVKELKFSIDEIISVGSYPIEDFRQYWKEHPDLRLIQALVNLGLVDNGSYYSLEETDYLVEKGRIKFEEINFWGVNYNKKGKKLKETQWKRLCDLDIDHIRNIYKWFNDNFLNGVKGINKKYYKYFEDRVKEENKAYIEDLLTNIKK